MNLILLLFLISGNNSYFFLNSFIIVHALLSALLFYLVDNIQKKVFSRNLSILGGFSIFFPKLSLLI
jgi:NADH:ubiquinone oxidoreductase subunit 4 (subunit M)